MSDTPSTADTKSNDEFDYDTCDLCGNVIDVGYLCDPCARKIEEAQWVITRAQCLDCGTSCGSKCVDCNAWVCRKHMNQHLAKDHNWSVCGFGMSVSKLHIGCTTVIKSPTGTLCTVHREPSNVV